VTRYTRKSLSIIHDDFSEDSQRVLVAIPMATFFLSHDTEIKIGILEEIFKVDVEVNLEEFLAALPRPLPFRKCHE
jgi:hypothetical protein